MKRLHAGQLTGSGRELSGSLHGYSPEWGRGLQHRLHWLQQLWTVSRQRSASESSSVTLLFVGVNFKSSENASGLSKMCSVPFGKTSTKHVIASRL